MKQSLPPQPPPQPVDPSAMQQMMLAAQIPLILADGIQLVGGSWSVIISLMQTRAVGAQLAAMPAATVSLSWPLAKALHRMLGDVIARVEQAEGNINLPKSFETALAVVEEPAPALGQPSRPAPKRARRKSRRS